MLILFRNLLIFCFILGCLISCGHDVVEVNHAPQPKVTDPIFNAHISKFEDLYNIDVNTPIVFGDVGEYAGVCYIYSNGYTEIQINEKNWSFLTKEQKEQLIFHELGHCVFGLDHNDNHDNGCPESIMRSYMFSPSEIDSCYKPFFDDYIDELGS